MECPLNRNCLTLPQILFIYQTEIVKDNCGGQPAKNIFMPFGIDYFCIFNIMVVEGDEATMKMTPFKLIVAILLLAGMAADVFGSWDQIHLFLQDHRTYQPDPEAAAVYCRAYRIYRDLYEQTKDSCRGLAGLYR